MYNSCALWLKQRLVGSAAGRALETTREHLALWRAIRSKPEQGSRMFQDRCGRILLAALCRPDRVFMDVGAHIGSIIASVRHRLPGVEIVAVEAVPEKAEWLKKNREWTPGRRRVWVHQRAAVRLVRAARLPDIRAESGCA